MKMTKQNIKTFMVAIALMAAGTTVFAQEANADKKGNRPNREQRMENMANDIAQQLGLNEKTSKKFIKVFKEQQEERMKLMPRRGGMPPKGERPDGPRPESNSGQASQNSRPMGGMKRPPMSEEDMKKMKELDEKYDKEYAKILSKDQISQMNTIKQEMMKKNRPGGNSRQHKQ